MKLKFLKAFLINEGCPDEEPAALTVGKVYNAKVSWYHRKGFVVVDDKGDDHHFHAMDAGPDSDGFASADYWEVVDER